MAISRTVFAPETRVLFCVPQDLNSVVDHKFNHSGIFYKSYNNLTLTSKCTKRDSVHDVYLCKINFEDFPLHSEMSQIILIFKTFKTSPKRDIIHNFLSCVSCLV